MPGPLAGFTILELDLMAPARLTGYYLAALGATVINVESPDKNRDKSLTFRNDTDSRWLWYQQGKKSIVLDLKDPEQRGLLHALATTADGVIEGFRPGAAARLGCDYGSLSRDNPALVYASVTAFGQTGPLAPIFGRETTYAAYTGLLDLLRPDGEAPLMLPYLTVDVIGGMHGAMALLAALLQARVSGKGQYVDAAAYDALFGLLGMRIHDLQLGSWFGTRPRHVTSGIETMDVFVSSDDRYIVFTADNQAMWQRFCEAIDAPWLLPLHDGLAAGADPAKRSATRAALATLFASRTMDEWQSLNLRQNLGIAPVLTLAETLDQPHTRERGMMTAVQHPILGTVRAVGNPFTFSGTPTQAHDYPAFGADTDAVFEAAGLGDRWRKIAARSAD